MFDNFLKIRRQSFDTVEVIVDKMQKIVAYTLTLANILSYFPVPKRLSIIK
jgi:hypothetical protein